MQGERPTPAGLIDAAPWTAYQIRTVLLITLTILFDGMDQNLLAITVPALARAWHVEAQQFANVTALGTLAILVGSATAGPLADRIGRRWTLIGSMLLYGAASLCGAFAWNIDSIGAVRLVSGLGLGAALTTAVVAIAEHTPARRRAVILSTTILGMPLGGIGAGAIGAGLIGAYGWQSVYVVGGVLPLMLALVFMAILPETPAYLALRGDARILAYFARMRVPVPERPDRAAPSHGPARGNPLALLSPEFRRNTLLLWAGIFASLLISYEILGWMPALLARNGASVALTSASVSYLSIGSLAGGVLASVLIYLFGSRRTAIGAGLLSVLVTLWLAMMFDRAPTGPAVLWSLPLALVGVAIINGLFYAIMPSVYPEHVRGAGIGIGMAVGRAGAVASAYVGAWALGGGGALLRHSGDREPGRPGGLRPRRQTSATGMVMAHITYIEFGGTAHGVEVDEGMSVMEGAVRNGVPGIDATCGGACACATCHVYVDPAWQATVGPSSAEEADMLEFANDVEAGSRLSCQIAVTAALDGLIVRMPESQG